MSVSNRNEIDYDPSPEERIKLECGECGKKVLTREMVLTGEGVRCLECMAKLGERYRVFKSGTGKSETLKGADALPVLTEPLTPFKTVLSSENAQSNSESPPVIEIKVDTTYCKLHPKVETGLKCSRCGVPICPRCMVYSPVGLRCPDCEKNATRPAAGDSRKVTNEGVKDTGFRSYWKRNSGSYPITSSHYFLAALAAIGAAIAGALVWGFLLNANFRGLPETVPGETWFLTITRNNISLLGQLIAQSFQGSIHLFPEIILAIAISEAISRVTGDRRGRGLQIIAVFAVLLGILLTFVVLGARIYTGYSSGFPPLGNLFSSAFEAFSYMFRGDNIAIVIFWLIGIIFAWVRLNK